MKTRMMQQGSALVVALFVFALAVIITVAMTEQQSLDIRKTSHLLQRDQALQYAFAVERWGGTFLLKDKEDNDYDHLNEAWASQVQPLPVDGGIVSGVIRDRQGCFNLNNLGLGQNQEAALNQLKRLLTALELDASLALAILDWLDKDVELRFPSGAEDNEYLGLSPPYRAANGLVSDVSELVLIKGIDHTALNLLKPHVCAIPELIPINVNTATGPALMSLADDWTEEVAQKIIQARGQEGFETVQAFLSSEALNGLQPPNNDSVSVSSDYFLIDSRAQIGASEQRLKSLVKRSRNKLVVVRRSFGE